MISLTVHAVLMVLLCLLFPVISKVFVEPLMLEMFGVYVSVLPVSVMYMLVILICFIFAVPMIAYVHTRRMQTSRKLSYMNGVNEGDNVSFTDSFGEPKKLVMSNWYFKNFFGQRKLMVPCEVITTAVIIVELCIIIGGTLLW